MADKPLIVRWPPRPDRADGCQPSAALASPSLRDRLNVSQWPAPINTSRLTGGAVPTAWTPHRARIPLNRRVSVASAAHAPRRAPSHAGTHASRSVAMTSDASARTPCSSQDGHNRWPKKLLSDYPRGVWNYLTCRWFSVPDALPIALALPVPLLFAGHSVPVSLLGFPVLSLWSASRKQST